MLFYTIITTSTNYTILYYFSALALLFVPSQIMYATTFVSVCRTH